MILCALRWLLSWHKPTGECIFVWCAKVESSESSDIVVLSVMLYNLYISPFFPVPFQEECHRVTAYDDTLA